MGTSIIVGFANRGTADVVTAFKGDSACTSSSSDGNRLSRFTSGEYSMNFNRFISVTGWGGKESMETWTNKSRKGCHQTPNLRLQFDVYQGNLDSRRIL
jgi:heme-degrading monooxygenase HmoA